MKKKEVALAIFLLTGLTLQAQERVTQYKVRDAIEVRTPIMNDSINPKGEKHSTKMLLKTPVVLDLPDAPLQSLTVDTAGYLTLDKADSRVEVFSNRLYLAGSQVHDKCLCVEIIGNRMITAILSDSAEGLGTCCKQ